MDRDGTLISVGHHSLRNLLAIAGSAVIACGLAYYLAAPAELRQDVVRPIVGEREAARGKGGPTVAIAERIDRFQRFVSTHFAGDESCAACHEEIYRAHQRSGHSQTLQPMHESELADRLIADGSYRDPLRDQEFRFGRESGRFVVEELGGSSASLPVTWLLGSGIHAQTPVAVDADSRFGVELRWSLIAHRDRVGVTPDHERFTEYRRESAECFGRPMDEQDVRSCLGCHATIVPPSPLPAHEDLIVPNVGCERCHGPRKDHVEAALQGLAGDVAPLVGFANAEAYIDQCAQCHRDETTVSPTAGPHELARFQPYGLKQSRCFQAAPEQMTCSACHDPHDTVHQDRVAYNTTCLQCHPSDSPTGCRPQPSGDCVECHMPRVEWIGGVSFHDHHIRIPAE